MLTLRHYQQEALEALIEAREQGQRRVILSLATGGGKTLIFVRLVSLLARHGRVLILVHREELVHQTLAKLTQMAPDLQIGVVKADRNEVNAPVVLASVQTLAQWRRSAPGRGERLKAIDVSHKGKRVSELYGFSVPSCADFLYGDVLLQRWGGSTLGEVSGSGSGPQESRSRRVDALSSNEARSIAVCGWWSNWCTR